MITFDSTSPIFTLISVSSFSENITFCKNTSAAIVDGILLLNGSLLLTVSSLNNSYIFSLGCLNCNV